MSNTVDTAAPTNSALSGNYSSVRPNSPEEAARLFNAVSAAKPLKDAVNTELTVVDLVVRTAPFTDDQGTITERQVATLVTDTGEAFASNSPTVVDSLRDLIAIMGQPRTGFWGAGLKVVPKLNPSGNGRSFISLTLPAAKK